MDCGRHRLFEAGLAFGRRAASVHGFSRQGSPTARSASASAWQAAPNMCRSTSRCICRSPGVRTRRSAPEPGFPTNLRSRRSPNLRSISCLDLGVHLGRRAFRRLTWRDGTCGKLASNFCFRRVKVAHDDGTPAADRDPVWLVLEWPQGETRPTKFALTTLPPSDEQEGDRVHPQGALAHRACVRGAQRGAWGWITSRAVPSRDGTTTSRSFSAAMRSSSPNVCGIFPPRPNAPVAVTRSHARPERHFADSFATARLAIARVLVGWLPRCPLCQRPPPARTSPPPHALARSG